MHKILFALEWIVEIVINNVKDIMFLTFVFNIFDGFVNYLKTPQVYRKMDRQRSRQVLTRIKRSLDLSLNSMLVKLSKNSDPKPGLNYSNSTEGGKNLITKVINYAFQGKRYSFYFVIISVYA